MSDSGMTVLVTGGAGYIGSTLTRKLLDRGHEVKVLDRFFFGKESLEEISDNENLEMIRDDVRHFDPEILEDIDVVMDLAALSNDPAGELDPNKTWDINYMGRARVAKLAKLKGVDQYIQASTCSIYGQQEGMADETSEVNPLTTYAKAHRKLEKEVLPMADENFSVTCLRQATVYGYSYRMRFDLAINGMTGAIYDDGELGVMRDGSQWRPFVHVEDTSRAFIEVAEADKDTVNGEIFNVGSNQQNYQIKTLAEDIMNAFDFEVDWEWYGDPDDRSYRVEFTKIKEKLGFEPKHTPEEAAKNIYRKMEEGKLEKTDKTSTVGWYRKLIKSDKLISGKKQAQKLL